MSLASILNSVQNYMTTNFMVTDNEWLSECVGYLFENGHSVDEIKTLTKEQWLLNNLSIVSPGCLPHNLKGHKTILPGRYVLQINAAVDIGTPLYQQYLKLQKVSTENIEATTKFEDKVPSQRMIKLYMTDGVQEVTGIEYRPMRNLSVDVTPGSKILIKGPVECRRGMLLLTESAIELLGGEVEELIQLNSQSSLLSSKVKMQLPQSSITVENPPRNRDIPSPHMPITPSPTNDIHQPPTNFIEDDIDVKELDAIEAQYSESLTKRSSDDDFSNPVKKLKTDPIYDPIYDVPDDDVFVDEEYLREIEMQLDEKENVLQNSVTKPEVIEIDDTSRVKEMPIEPFVYIKHINDIYIYINRIGMVFKVKAQILKILSKLRISMAKGGWSLSCTIVDGTAALDVDFSSVALSKLIGFTPQEMIKMKKEMTNEAFKERVSLALQKASEHLQILYCIFELTVMEKPIITKLIPFDNSHVDILRKRLQDSGL